VALFASIVAVLLGLLACAWAVQDHFRLHRSLFEARRQCWELRTRAAHRSNLSKAVAHELKNPITAIICAADSLRLMLSNEISEDSGKTLNYIGEYGEHVLQLMQDFIDINGGVQEQVISDKRVIEVAPIINSVVGILEPGAGKRGISIVVKTGDNRSRVEIDPKHLKQIVFNLVHNAVKFAPNEGEVTVWVSDNVEPDWVKIEVTDDGPGIPPLILAALFDTPGCTVLKPIAETNGNGIGLFLCKSLIELEQGRFEISDHEGHGTKISIFFRAVKVDTAPIALPIEDHVLRPLHGQAILLVDDDRHVREVMARLIEALGGVVDSVGAAVEAVDALQSKVYSAVVIDEAVDGMKGYEVARQIRQDPHSGNVIIVVAGSEPNDGAVGANYGVDSWLEKPLDSSMLMRSLMRSLMRTH